ncbi:tyrosine-type recombinase/integrase [Dermabacteraceae bacterium P13095]
MTDQKPQNDGEGLPSAPVRNKVENPCEDCGRTKNCPECKEHNNCCKSARCGRRCRCGKCCRCVGVRRYGVGTEFKALNGNREVFYFQRTVKNSDGSTRKITGTGSTPQIAKQRYEENFALHLERGRNSRQPRRLSWMLDEWLEHYCNHVGVSSKTRYRNNIYTHVIGDACKASGYCCKKPCCQGGCCNGTKCCKKKGLGNIQIQDVKVRDLAKLFSTLEKEAGEYASLHTMTALRTMFKTAKELNFIAADPFESGTVLKRRKPKTKVSQDDERNIEPFTELYLDLLSWMNEQRHYYYPLFLTMGLGLRVSELLGLQWSCIDLRDKNNSYLEVKQQLRRAEGGQKHGIKNSTKNGKDRKIPLPENLYDELFKLMTTWENAPARKGPDWQRTIVFTMPRGNFIRHSTFSKIWDKTWTEFISYLDSAGVKESRYKMLELKPKKAPFRPHYIRHIATSILLANGTPVTNVASILGHSSIEVTLSIYSHVMPEVTKKAIIEYGKGLGVVKEAKK